MMVEQIRNALRTQPFQPFAVRLTEGTTYIVRHPDWLSIPPVEHPREVTYYSVEGKGAEEYRTHWINIGLILEIIVPADVEAQTPKAEGNRA